MEIIENKNFEEKPNGEDKKMPFHLNLLKEIIKEKNFEHLEKDLCDFYFAPLKGAIIREKYWNFVAKENFGGNLELIVLNQLVVFQMFSIFEGQKTIYFDINSIVDIGCVGVNLGGKQF